MKNTLLLLLLWPITALGYYGLALSMSSLGAIIVLFVAILLGPLFLFWLMISFGYYGLALSMSSLGDNIVFWANYCTIILFVPYLVFGHLLHFNSHYSLVP